MLINHNVNVAEIIPIWFALNKPMNNSDVASRIPISINAGVGIVAITKKAAPMAIIESVTDMSTLKVCKRIRFKNVWIFSKAIQHFYVFCKGKN